MAYVNQILLAGHQGGSPGVRNQREAVTLGTAIDLLLNGSLASLGDLLMQRLKALETAMQEHKLLGLAGDCRKELRSYKKLLFKTFNIIVYVYPKI